MHDIEPHHHWRHSYQSEKDRRSPFFGRQYSEFTFSNKVYNYFIHPQWDEMGSKTLYLKIIFADYHRHYAIIELIGEWNDLLYNDVMYLKREIVDSLAQHEISRYIILCDHVLNYHTDDASYYEEWYDDVKEEDGWICFMNLLPHVEEEMRREGIQHYVHLGEELNNILWQKLKPGALFQMCQEISES